MPHPPVDVLLSVAEAGLEGYTQIQSASGMKNKQKIGMLRGGGGEERQHMEGGTNSVRLRGMFHVSQGTMDVGGWGRDGEGGISKAAVKGRRQLVLQRTLKMLPKSRPGRPSWTSFLKKFKQATMALPWRREERTRLSVFGRMCSFIVTTEPGLTSITVHSRVNTNWEMWRSLSLIRAGSSSKAVW